jgi:phosphoglycerate kinase
MYNGFYTMDDVSLSGKTILARVDINTSYDPEKNKIAINRRIRQHGETTVKELHEKGAKVALLAHQSRPGKDDFIPLEQHAAALSKYAKCDIGYVDDLIGHCARDAIKGLKNGDVILLENVRFLAEETLDVAPEKHSESIFVRTLAPLADLYMGDAFSTAHRNQASVVGFAEVLPAIGGRVVETEMESLEKAVDKPQSPNVFIFGGAKPDDCLKVMRRMFEAGKVDMALTCGITGELFLIARGHDLGAKMDWMKKHDYLAYIPEVEQLLIKFGHRIWAPVDLAYEKGGRRVEVAVKDLPVKEEVFDIGMRTAEKYGEIIRNAETINIKGPAGMYENPAFARGTRTIFTAIADSAGYSLVGGGDTLAAVDSLRIDDKKFSYVSLGGGVLLTYLSGKPLPHIEALKRSAVKFKSKFKANR